MLLSTSIAITAVFLTGCEASIKGLSSPNIGILPNGQIKSFKNFPLGGLLCDNAAKTTFLFEDYQVKDSISSNIPSTHGCTNTDELQRSLADCLRVMMQAIISRKGHLAET